MKLDQYDLKILSEIDKNARQTASHISKKVKLPKETVNYRIKRLLSEEIITRFYPIINLSIINYQFYMIYIKYHKLSPKHEEKIVADLRQRPECSVLSLTQPPYDLVFLSWHQNSESLVNFMHEFISTFGKYISEKEIHQIVKGYKFYLSFENEQEVKLSSYQLVGSETEKVDELDKKILYLISKNARIRLVDIAQLLDASARVIRYRIKRMERFGLLFGYCIDLNKEKINKELVQIHMSLRNLAKIPSIIEFFRKSRVALAAYALIGKYDLMIEVSVANDKVLRNLINDFRSQFLDVYIYFDVLHVYQEFIAEWCPFSFPEIVLEENKEFKEDDEDDEE